MCQYLSDLVYVFRMRGTSAIRILVPIGIDTEIDEVLLKSAIIRPGTLSTRGVWRALTLGRAGLARAHPTGWWCLVRFGVLREEKVSSQTPRHLAKTYPSQVRQIWTTVSRPPFNVPQPRRRRLAEILSGDGSGHWIGSWVRQAARSSSAFDDPSVELF